MANKKPIVLNGGDKEELQTADTIAASDIGILTGVGSPTVDQLQEYLANTGSAGFFSGGAITDAGAGTVDIAAGSGMIRDTASSTAEVKPFSWSASLGVAITLNTTEYIFVDNTGTISTNADEFLEAENNIILGLATNENGVIVAAFNLGVRLDESIGQAGRFMRRTHGITRDLRKGGLTVGETGTRNITRSAGVLWWGRTEYNITALDTSIAGGFTTYVGTTLQATGVTQWPNLQYNNAGTLTTLTNNKWAVLWFYIETDSDLIMVYGTGEYSSQASAEAEAIPSPLPVRLDHGILSARLVFQKNAATASISSAFTNIFAGSPITDHLLLSNIGTNSHATIDTHLSAANPHSASAASGANSDITSITGLTTDLTIAQGGTGQSTAQAAIDALSAVAGATNEHVLTKDTATGNAVFKVAAGGGGSGDSIAKAFTKTAHGFAVGDVVYNTGTDETSWAKASTSSLATLGYGVVSAVADVDNFTITFSGYVSGLTGLTAGSYYYTGSTAGLLTTTEGPVYSNPIMLALTTTTAMVLPWRASGSGTVGSNVGQNVIINSDFDIWQRGTNFTAPINADRLADMWLYATTGTGVADIMRNGTIPTQAESGHSSNYSLFVDVTTADTSIATSDQYVLLYRMEGYDYKQFEGNTGTLSFWVRSAKTGIHCVSFRNASPIDRSYIAEYTVNTANTWEKKTITVPFNYSGGTWEYTLNTGLNIGFALAVGSDKHGVADTWNSANNLSTSNQVNVMDNTANTFRLAQIKFELGSTATPFSTAGANYEDEFAMCQRYYSRRNGVIWSGDITTGNVYYFGVPLNPMRVAPTVVAVFVGAYGFPASAPTPAAITDQYFRVNNTSNATVAKGYFQFNYTAEAEL